MEPILAFGLEVTKWLQGTFPQLVGFFKLMSALGEENFYLVVLPLIYWCLDKKLGKNLVYIFLLADGINVLGKHAFRGPRPYWLDPSVGLSESGGYGVPSGHTQLTTVIYGFLAVWYKQGWLILLAVFMIVAMGLSRIYLGVHFVHDVAAGLLIGLVILTGFFVWRHYSGSRFSKLILGRKLFWAVMVPLVLAVVYVIVRLIIGAPNTAVAWAAYIPDAELNGLEGMATAFGTLLGLGIGINLEASRTRFMVDGPIWQRALRYLLGLAVTVAIYA
ncbi:MAG: phosphatase PAP2 family protein, partial [Anaerolineales bacterium]|nr:phosphatase PAP2 family protein [Anaerolineales bacterium]